MKTFKKILFGAGILFNSCAIVAMDNETDNQVSTESAKTTEKMNLLKTKDLKINQQNDIRTLLLKALDENGRLKSESLSRDEQDAVDLINAIQANKEPRNSLFYQNIEKIAKINSAASTTKNAPSLESQNTLQDLLSQLCKTTDITASQSPEADSNTKKTYYLQFYTGNKTLRKKFSKKNSPINQSPQDPSDDNNNENPLEYYHRVNDTIKMNNPMKARAITAPSQLSTQPQSSPAEIISSNKDNEKNIKSNSTIAPLNETISDPSPVDISELMTSLTSTRLDEDKLNEIKILLLPAFDKKGLLKSGTLSSDEQVAVDLLNAIQANSEAAKSTFYENINEIATTCSAFKPSEKALKSIFDKLYQDAKNPKPMRKITQRKQPSQQELEALEIAHNNLRRDTENAKIAQKARNAKFRKSGNKLRPEQIEALRLALVGDAQSTAVMPGNGDEINEEVIENNHPYCDRTITRENETEDSVLTNVVQSRPTIGRDRRRSSTSKRTAVMPQEELITKLSKDNNNDEMESAVMPFNPNGDDEGDPTCVIQ